MIDREKRNANNARYRRKISLTNMNKKEDKMQFVCPNVSLKQKTIANGQHLKFIWMFNFNANENIPHIYTVGIYLQSRVKSLGPLEALECLQSAKMLFKGSQTFSDIYCTLTHVYISLRSQRNYLSFFGALFARIWTLNQYFRRINWGLRWFSWNPFPSI